MGMTSVACINVGTAIAFVTMTLTLRWTNSVAISAIRSWRPSFQRYSIAMVRPSIQPSSRSRCTKAAVHELQLDASAPRNPMVGSFPACCARAAIGQAATAPPSSATNSRRPMPDMGGPSLRDYRTLNLPPTDRQVPVADLNCSESRSAPTVDQRLRDAGLSATSAIRMDLVDLVRLAATLTLVTV